MSLRRFLGLDVHAPQHPSETPSDPSETATVRRIVGQLEAMPLERARYLAGFAYVLSRAAAADLEISEVESRTIEQIVMEFGHLPEAQAVLVAEIAKSQARLYGQTEDYLVTREFRDMSTMDERIALLRCCYLVGAADETITADESSVLQEIARELDLDRTAVNAIRNEFADKLSAIQAMRRSAKG